MREIQKLKPVSIRVPKKLREELICHSEKNRRSLSSYCRIIVEDNYKYFGRNFRYNVWGSKDDNLVPLSFTISKELEENIVSHILSFKKRYYNQVTFSAFVRKVLSNSEKD